MSLLRSKVDIGFSFEFLYSDPHLVEVRILAWNGTFGGVAAPYVALGELERIAAKLTGFPARPLDNREIEFGGFSKGTEGVLMRFQADKGGHAHVEARMDSHVGGKRQSVTLHLPIEAAAVDLFLPQLRKLEHEHGQARLVGALDTSY